MYWTKLKINYIIKLRRKDSQREVNMKTYKIAFTGGPCAGKTSIIKETRKYLKSLGVSKQFYLINNIIKS